MDQKNAELKHSMTLFEIQQKTELKHRINTVVTQQNAELKHQKETLSVSVQKIDAYEKDQ